MGLLQVLFNKLIWYAIGAKRSPASILRGMLLELLLDLTLSKSKLNITRAYLYVQSSVLTKNSIAIAVIDQSAIRGLKQPSSRHRWQGGL